MLIPTLNHYNHIAVEELPRIGEEFAGDERGLIQVQAGTHGLLNRLKLTPTQTRKS
jgi:hypothetical protein